MIKKFDILLYKGKSPIAKLIQHVTNSPYSHVAIVLDEYHCLETDWKYPVKIRHLKYKKNQYEIMRYEELSEEEKEYMGKFINIYLNTQYDFKQVISHWLNLSFNFTISNSNSRFICSELADRMYKYAGIDLLPKFMNGSVTPADLSRSTKLINITKEIN